MKRLLISTFALGLATALPSALFAADEHHDSAPKGGAASTSHVGGGAMGSGHMSTSHMGGTSGTGHHTYTHTHHHTGGTAGGHATTGHPHVTVDLTTFHKNFTSPNHYHYGDYNGPPGYAYRQWGYGETLPAAYWAENYWLTSYLNFGLAPPPDGCVWVRVGPDALLIDEDNGQVVQAVYGVFY
jgi:Ni/Co efflux regulator RcnB